MKFVVHLCRLKLLKLGFVLTLMINLVVAGCAFRKAPAPPPLPVYPPVPENAIQELRHFPPGIYDKLEIITIEAEVGTQLQSAMKSVRESAAQKGANAIVILNETEFLQKVKKREVKIRRISYSIIHRR